MNCDLHIHSRHSFDAAQSIHALCLAAVQNHTQILAVTDHCDMTDGPEGIAYYLKSEPARMEEFAQAREAFPQLKLLYGIEIGNAHDRPEETRTFLETRSFDFVLGAVHFLSGGKDIYKLPYPDRDAVEAMFCEYFRSMRRLVSLGGFDSLAHLDYPLRVLRGKVDGATIGTYRELVEPILRDLAEKGIALEVNTRGTYDWQNRVGPEEWVLRRYRELGGRHVTIGSDAHTSKWIGAGFAQASAVLQNCGFDAYTIYENRQAVQIPLTH